MTPLIDKYINKEKIELIAIEKNFDTETRQEFIRFLDYHLEQEDRLGFDDFEEDPVASTIDFACEYINEFIKEKNNGYSLPWLKEFVNRKLCDDNKQEVSWAYYEVRKIDSDQALQDLYLYSKLTNRDYLFVKHFTYLIEEDVPNVTPSVEEQSIAYSRLYKEQINNGKTDVFAHQYAVLASGDQLHIIYCEDYAFAYQKAKQECKSDEYASAFANKYAEELVDVKLRFGISDDEESLDYAKQKADAYINGWEYATENKIANRNGFIQIYEHIYLNTYYADEGMPDMSFEDIKKMISEKSMEKYTILLNNKKGDK